MLEEKRRFALEKLTIRQAYIAMIRFLEQYYERGKSEDIADLLSGLSLDIWKDGSSADPAMWQDWRASVEHVLSETAETSEAFPLKRSEAG